ncbi:MAG: ABC transporter permease, partial [Bacilli bacterium]
MSEPKPKLKKGKLLLLPAWVWLVIFFLVPLLLISANAFFQRGTYGDVIYEFTLDNIKRMFDPLYLGILWRTIWVAALTTVICLFLSYPFAYGITRLSPRKQSIMLMLVTIPFWINFLVRSYAWIVILRSQGLVNSFLESIGLIDEPLNLLYNTPAVILGMVYSLLPFMVLPVYVSIEQLDRRKLD